MSEKKLLLKFDPNTIQHLGISLYSHMPNVLAELISNSWDADADFVNIKFIEESINKKTIIFEDDGIGMSFDDLNEHYLLIGRNRRSLMSEITEKGRNVIGKKGLGKLSIFGICNVIRIRTVKAGILNEFEMSLEKIKNTTKEAYEPDIISFNEITDEPSGTKLTLMEVRRKTPFNCKLIAASIAKKFTIFDQMKTTIACSDQDTILVTNEMKFEDFKKEFSWTFPRDFKGIDYSFASKIKGEIFTLETPIKDTEMKGIYLTSRGKIVNKAEFYGLRDTDLFHTYVTGYLEVDFIDEIEEDVISTDRQSLNWENEITRDLQKYLQDVIRKIGSDWKEKRNEKKINNLKVEKNIDVINWQKSLPSVERELSHRIISPILENSQLDIEESSNLIENVIDKFDNRTFHEYASRIADLNAPEHIPNLLKLMDEWKTIESKQYSDLAISRIEVINKFEHYLSNDTKEVPTLHNFLKKFSWILDPRILEFKDEVRYSTLLKENYPDDSLDRDDRRIDFLCSNALGGVLYVIEIKRSTYKVDSKAIEQAYEYGVFLKDKFASESGFSNVVAFVIGGEKSTNNGLFRAKEKTYRETGEVFVKTYTELLEQSKEYHREFITLFNDINKKQNDA
ncbi:ATP-binding protein [Paenibacillus sp. TC-CSREp1]|uniref:ATP-binding protein n=1 Tax=Paenibacillus sp. TC-CSREp1 TaxID=3410089 RepID=UPI003CF7AEE2